MHTLVLCIVLVVWIALSALIAGLMAEERYHPLAIIGAAIVLPPVVVVILAIAVVITVVACILALLGIVNINVKVE